MDNNKLTSQGTTENAPQSSQQVPNSPTPNENRIWVSDNRSSLAYSPHQYRTVPAFNTPHCASQTGVVTRMQYINSLSSGNTNGEELNENQYESMNNESANTDAQYNNETNKDTSLSNHQRNILNEQSSSCSREQAYCIEQINQIQTIVSANRDTSANLSQGCYSFVQENTLVHSKPTDAIDTTKDSFIFSSPLMLNGGQPEQLPHTGAQQAQIIKSNMNIETNVTLKTLEKPSASDQSTSIQMPLGGSVHIQPLPHKASKVDVSTTCIEMYRENPTNSHNGMSETGTPVFFSESSSCQKEVNEPGVVSAPCNNKTTDERHAPLSHPLCSIILNSNQLPTNNSSSDQPAINQLTSNQLFSNMFAPQQFISCQTSVDQVTNDGNLINFETQVHNTAMPVPFQSSTTTFPNNYTSKPRGITIHTSNDPTYSIASTSAENGECETILQQSLSPVATPVNVILSNLLTSSKVTNSQNLTTVVSNPQPSITSKNKLVSSITSLSSSHIRQDTSPDLILNSNEIKSNEVDSTNARSRLSSTSSPVSQQIHQQLIQDIHNVNFTPSDFFGPSNPFDFPINDTVRFVTASIPPHVLPPSTSTLKNRENERLQNKINKLMTDQSNLLVEVKDLKDENQNLISGMTNMKHDVNKLQTDKNLLSEKFRRANLKLEKTDILQDAVFRLTIKFGQLKDENTALKATNKQLIKDMDTLFDFYSKKLQKAKDKNIKHANNDSVCNDDSVGTSCEKNNNNDEPLNMDIDDDQEVNLLLINGDNPEHHPAIATLVNDGENESDTEDSGNGEEDDEDDDEDDDDDDADKDDDFENDEFSEDSDDDNNDDNINTDEDGANSDSHNDGNNDDNDDDGDEDGHNGGNNQDDYFEYDPSHAEEIWSTGESDNNDNIDGHNPAAIDLSIDRGNHNVDIISSYENVNDVNRIYSKSEGHNNVTVPDVSQGNTYSLPGIQVEGGDLAQVNNLYKVLDLSIGKIYETKKGEPNSDHINFLRTVPAKTIPHYSNTIRVRSLKDEFNNTNVVMYHNELCNSHKRKQMFSCISRAEQPLVKKTRLNNSILGDNGCLCT